MSLHSYTRIWLHVVWGTLNHSKLLFDQPAQSVSEFLYRYAKEKNIYMKINYVNPEHVHTLIDLPTYLSLEECIKLLKGASSHYINKEKIIKGKFSWGRGYGAFSVSESQLNKVIEYIKNQEEHHRVKSFQEEYELMLKKHNLVIHRS